MVVDKGFTVVCRKSYSILPQKVFLTLFLYINIHLKVVKYLNVSNNKLIMSMVVQHKNLGELLTESMMGNLKPLTLLLLDKDCQLPKLENRNSAKYLINVVSYIIDRIVKRYSDRFREIEDAIKIYLYHLGYSLGKNYPRKVNIPKNALPTVYHAYFFKGFKEGKNFKR